jgi:CubicO group peptidase (beta-lactamase class C family)
MGQARPPANARPDGPWRQYADTGAAGYDTAALAAARQHAERTSAAAVLLIQSGRVVVAWGDPSQRFVTRSIRKSLVDLMFGTASARKAVQLDATLAALDIDDRQPLSVRERRATLGHLLAARSGVYHPAAREPASMTKNRPLRESAPPGEQWFYNNWDFNALGVIYGKLTGVDLLTGFRRTLAEPLGLEDYRPQDGYLIREPSRSRHPAYEFPLSARDLARVGQLVLQNGRWNGQQLVDSGWLEQSFKLHTPFPQGGGYGYLWWIDAARFRARDKTFPKLDAVTDIAATGLGEQMLLVVPSLDVVFVHLTPADEGAAVDGQAYDLAEMLLQARRGDPRANAATVDVTWQPLTAKAPVLVERKAIALSGNASEYAGSYEIPNRGMATVTFIDGGLFIDVPGRGEAELFQEAPDRFFLRVADVTVAFERDATGVVAAARVVDRGKPLVVKRVAK